MSLQSRLASLIGDFGADMKKALAQDIKLTMQGPVSVRTGTVRYPVRTGSWIIERVTIQTSSAPTGSAIIVDVNKNGTTIHSGGTGRATIAASSTTGTTTTFSTATLTTGDYLTVDVDQKGSSNAGDDLVVVITLRRA